jgi:uncharacterized protein YjiS (DUF1127 family)
MCIFVLAFQRNTCILCMRWLYHGGKQMSLTTRPFTRSAVRVVASPAQAPRFRAWPALIATLVLWRKRGRTRQRPHHLDNRALADVARARQLHEFAEPLFWLPGPGPNA